MERTLKAKPVDGKEAWYGQYCDAKGAWRSVRNNAGLPIIYTTRQHALNAAKLFSGQQEVNEQGRDDGHA